MWKESGVRIGPSIQAWVPALTVVAATLLYPPTISSLEPDQLAQAIAHANQEAPASLVVEVALEESWESPIVDVEFADGGALYIEVTPEGLSTIGTSQERPDGENQRIARRLEEEGSNILPIAEAYARALEAIEADPGGPDLRPEDLYQIEYEIEYGRLLLEITFEGRRGGRDTTLYVDPGDGRIIAAERSE